MGKKKSAVVIEIGSNGESQIISKNGNGEHAKNGNGEHAKNGNGEHAKNGNGHDAVENGKPQKIESKKNGTNESPKPTTTNGVPKPEKTEKKDKAEKKEVNENTEKTEKIEKVEKKEKAEKKEKVEKKENTEKTEKTEKKEKAEKKENTATPKANGAAEKVEKKEKVVEKKEKVVEKVEKSPKPETSKLVNLSTKKDKLDGIDMSITATGQLLSNPLSYDVKINNFSLAFHGVNLIVDTILELNSGRRYGLIGRNGSGKSTFLKCLARREVPIPPFVDIFLLDKEQAPSEKTALEIVMSTEEEVARLEKEVEDLLNAGGDAADSERLNQLYERLDELDADKAESRAAQILNGLGFTKEMQRKPAKEFSGGWRMRIALARALFVSPALLLLDEPTNHLDLESCVWLEDYLATYKRCLIVISHSQDFLNGVCTNIMYLNKRQLTYYGGNYDTYVKTRSEIEENQMKQWKREQDEIAHMKEYIARFGHGSAKLAKQAQSKEKTLAKMEAKGLTEKVEQEKVLNFRFTDCGKLNPPVLTFLDVGFAYSGLKKDMLYTKLEFGVDCDSRIALVGRNGCGKSTLLKLMVGELIPTEGSVRCNPHLRIARYHQHLADQLDMEATPIEYMRSQFPGFSIEEMRSKVGRFGITGDAQMAPIKNLSDGQRSRVVFAWLAEKRPHLLLLDEPTNHLDMETIDSLAAALKVFEGGMVLVSHDFRLINQVAEEIWICGNKTITKYFGDIVSYKDRLRKENADFK